MKIIEFKENVRIKKWTPAIARIIDVCEMLMNRYIWCPTLTITSANDSEHMKNSRHYTDEALDIRSKNFNTITDKYLFKSALEEELGDKFTVLLENIGRPNEHFHVQVAREQVYP